MNTKKRLYGWYFFDVASQPYFTLGLTFIFAPYFARTLSNRFVSEGMAADAAAAQAQSIWSLGLTLGGLLIAFSAPVLGAMADAAGRRLPWVWGFSGLYVVGAGCLWFAYPDASNYVWMLVAFLAGFIAVEFTTIFTNAILPDLGNEEEIGAISGSGFALGYAGGVVSLIIMLLFFEDGAGQTLLGMAPLFGLDATQSEGTRFVGPFVVFWYVLFMIPFFMWVREAPVANRAPRISVSQALSDIMQTLKKLPQNRSLSAYLGSSLFYRDALNGIYGFGGVYATLVLEWEIMLVGLFGILAAVTAGIFSWVGGRADRAFGPKPVIVFTICCLIAVCIVIVSMTREELFGIALNPDSNMPDIIMFICGGVIGAAGGALQSASRTMMVRHADPDRPAEAFGLYALSGKATAFLAPALIGAATVMSGSPRLGLTPVVLLFIVGLVLLIWVKPTGNKQTA